MKPGKLYGVGVGPGDPELLTLKAARIIAAADVIAFHAARHGRSNARAVVAELLGAQQTELALIYPVTTEQHPREGYETAMQAFYTQSAAQIAAHLDNGRDVVILCEGDPMFYGSYMYLHDRLAGRYDTQVIPGICSVMASTASLGTPLARRDTPLAVLPGTMSEEALAERFAAGEAYVIMKLGRNFAKVRRALERAGIAERALYIQHASMASERCIPLADVVAAEVPYFSLIVVPGIAAPKPSAASATDATTEQHLVSPVVAIQAIEKSPGQLCVVGLGPGPAGWLAPEARLALERATHVVGYQPYLDRVEPRAGQQRHGSDNRVEIERARHALELASAGEHVCVVSSGDPGVFAMASAVMEAVEFGEAHWRDLNIKIIPGISAMQAAAARVGAPLGHDFCAISLSDRLKPWEIVAKRLEAVAMADFAIALYNPISSERLHQIHDAQKILARYRAATTPVILAHRVGDAQERIVVTDVASFVSHTIDMRTVVLIGASSTRCIERVDQPPFVYTPRSYAAR